MRFSHCTVYWIDLFFNFIMVITTSLYDFKSIIIMILKPAQYWWTNYLILNGKEASMYVVVVYMDAVLLLSLNMSIHYIKIKLFVLVLFVSFFLCVLQRSRVL